MSNISRYISAPAILSALALSACSDDQPVLTHRDLDGSFHMLVSTRLGGKGVLAEYTSTDLRDWTSAGVFMTMMWDRFYECPDLFRMGDWWYLVYSEQHDAIRRVQYFKGRTIDELRACTANDAGLWPDSHEGFLDSRGFYAGKTASDGTRKINLEEEGGIGFIPDTDGYTFATPADGVYHITIVTDNSVITVYINDAAAFTTRIYGTLKNCWSINSYGADINISDITLQSK